MPKPKYTHKEDWKSPNVSPEVYEKVAGIARRELNDDGSGLTRPYVLKLAKAVPSPGQKRTAADE